MFDYDFQTCPVEYGKRGQIDPEGYRKLIRDKAREGWRLVQIFIANPPAVPYQYELIFERPRPG